MIEWKKACVKQPDKAFFGYRVSQTWFFQTERLAGEPFERKVLAVGAAHRQHLPLPVSAFGAKESKRAATFEKPCLWLYLPCTSVTKCYTLKVLGKLRSKGIVWFYECKGL